MWDLPEHQVREHGAARAIGYVVNDWQLSGVLTAGSAPHYDLGYSYNTNGGAKNLTGSPDYGTRASSTRVTPARAARTTSTRSSTLNAVTGPGYFSTGLESGRNILLGCADHTVDLAIARNIRLGGGRSVQLRLDAFNAFNTAIITGRQTQIPYNSPTDLTMRNSQLLADGTVDPAKLKPRDAGFGAANAWSTNSNNTNYQRVIQVTVRFAF